MTPAAPGPSAQSPARWPGPCALDPKGLLLPVLRVPGTSRARQDTGLTPGGPFPPAAPSPAGQGSRTSAPLGHPGLSRGDWRHLGVPMRIPAHPSPGLFFFPVQCPPATHRPSPSPPHGRGQLGASAIPSGGVHVLEGRGGLGGSLGAEGRLWGEGTGPHQEGLVRPASQSPQPAGQPGRGLRGGYRLAWPSGRQAGQALVRSGHPLTSQATASPGTLAPWQARRWPEGVPSGATWAAMGAEEGEDLDLEGPGGRSGGDRLRGAGGRGCREVEGGGGGVQASTLGCGL